MSTTATQCDMMTLVWGPTNMRRRELLMREVEIKDPWELTWEAGRGGRHQRSAHCYSDRPAKHWDLHLARPSHTLPRQSLFCADANTETNCPALLFSGKTLCPQWTEFRICKIVG